jgi:hypothetical protein
VLEHGRLVSGVCGALHAEALVAHGLQRLAQQVLLALLVQHEAPEERHVVKRFSCLPEEI